MSIVRNIYAQVQGPVAGTRQNEISLCPKWNKCRERSRVQTLGCPTVPSTHAFWVIF